MKFNYFKTAKVNGHDRKAFDYAYEQKYLQDNCRYMAANWLAWAYTFQRKCDKNNLKKNLRYFLEEIARICRK